MGTNAPALSISSIAPRQIMGALAAVVVAVSGFLNWEDVDAAGLRHTAKGTKVPVEFLVDKNTTSTSPSILLALGIAAALIAIFALVPRSPRLSGFAGGALAIVVVALYCIQVQGLLDDNHVDISLTDFISIGTYLALVGGVAGVIASLLPGSTRAAAPAAAPPAPPPAAPAATPAAAEPPSAERPAAESPTAEPPASEPPAGGPPA